MFYLPWPNVICHAQPLTASHLVFTLPPYLFPLFFHHNHCCNLAISTWIHIPEHQITFLYPFWLFSGCLNNLKSENCAVFGLISCALLPFLYSITMDSTAKHECPEGSKDGPQNPGAPPCGCPKKIVEQFESEGKPKQTCIFCYCILSPGSDTIFIHCSSIFHI